MFNKNTDVKLGIQINLKSFSYQEHTWNNVIQINRVNLNDIKR